MNHDNNENTKTIIETYSNFFAVARDRVTMKHIFELFEKCLE